MSERTQSNPYSLRIDESLKNRAREHAHANRRSLNSEISLLIEEGLVADQGFFQSELHGVLAGGSTRMKSRSRRLAPKTAQNIPEIIPAKMKLRGLACALTGPALLFASFFGISLFRFYQPPLKPPKADG